jgi:hypothetical protein
MHARGRAQQLMKGHMKIDGGCHCGRIHFEAEVDPATVGICHCADCQTLSGSPYRSMVAARAETFSIQGEPKIYIKIADSGTRRAQAFCPECGAPIYAAAPDNPPTYSIRIGSIRQRQALRAPVRQIWCDSALPWALDLLAIPKARRQI